MIDFLSEAASLQNQVVEYRRFIHQHPELSKNEFQTAELVSGVLQELGMEVRRNVGAPYPGVVGLLRGANSGPTVALRADMDALPITEQVDTPFKSQEAGKMHACGHDAHVAIALGAAHLLAAHRNELHGNVQFIFQPNEEVEGGAVPMIRDGALDNVDTIFGLHVDPEYQSGDIVLGYNTVMAASDRLTIRILGKGTHGAYPHRGIDAIAVAGHFLCAVQNLVSRETDPLDSAVITFGAINGGTVGNIVCDSVELKGILRTLNPKTRERMIHRIEEVLSGVCQAFACTYEFTRAKSHTATINNNELVDFAKKIGTDLFTSKRVLPLPGSRMGVEDFSFYLERVPGVFWFLGIGNPKKNSQYPWHSPMFSIDEDALASGVAMQSALVYNYLKTYAK